MSRRVVGRLGAIALVAASSAGAQPVTKDRCRVDTSASWYRTQRAWLDESKGGWSDGALRDALLQGVGVDATKPLAVQTGFEIAGAPTTAHADSATVSRLRTLAATRGSTWPVRSVVGPAGVRAVWLAASADTSIAAPVLHRMMEAGPDESLAADVATMEDRMRLRAGRKQLYGTQLRVENGRLAPLPMEDPEHVDLRRDDAGLPPIALSLCLARQSPR